MSNVDEADLQVVENRLRASATFSGCLEWKALNGSRDRLTLKMVLIGRISLRWNNLPLKTVYRQHSVRQIKVRPSAFSWWTTCPASRPSWRRSLCPNKMSCLFNSKFKPPKISDFLVTFFLLSGSGAWRLWSDAGEFFKLVFRRSYLWIWHQNVQFGVIFKEKSWKIWQQITHEMMCLAS